MADNKKRDIMVSIQPIEFAWIEKVYSIDHGLVKNMRNWSGSSFMPLADVVKAQVNGQLRDKNNIRTLASWKG